MTTPMPPAPDPRRRPPTPSSPPPVGAYGWTPPPPPPQRNRLPLILAAVAGAVLLLLVGLGAATAAYFAGQASQDPPAASASPEPRLNASELAKRALTGCTAPEVASTAPTGGALERVNCGTVSGSDAVVSTYPDDVTARADAERVHTLAADLGVGAGSGVLFGPYWVINCSVRMDCALAKSVIGGEFVA